MPRTTKPGTPLSRRLRRNMTEAERGLWWHLKRVPVENTHFRRQVPIGSFVVDFALLSHRLVIEVDGDQHGREPFATDDRFEPHGSTTAASVCCASRMPT